MAFFITGITVQTQQVTAQTFGVVESVICTDNPDDCCSGTGTGDGIDDCCPTGTPLSSITFVADGPMGAVCATCELTGDLLLVDSMTKTWRNRGGGGGCDGNTGLDLTLYCADGNWRLSGKLAPPDVITVFFDVPADIDLETLLLTGAVSVPGCGTVIIAVQQPCPAVVSYDCVDGTCVAVLGTEGTYATAELCAAACGEGGSLGCCLDLPPQTTLYVNISDIENVELTWNGSHWVGSVDLACGDTLFLRYATACELEYSCDGENFSLCSRLVDCDGSCDPFCSPGHQIVLPSTGLGCVDCAVSYVGYVSLVNDNACVCVTPPPIP